MAWEIRDVARIGLAPSRRPGEPVHDRAAW